MCSQITLFSSITKLAQPIIVSLPNGQHITVTFTGQVPLIDNIVLDKVLYVPSFKFNLLSVSRLTQQLNCFISFSNDTCYMQGCSLRKPLPIGNSQRGLYILPSSSSTVASSNPTTIADSSQIVSNTATTSAPFPTVVNTTAKIVSNCNTDALLWHYRLGHLPMSKLKSLSICNVC